jgi:hypothetical protein
MPNINLFYNPAPQIASNTYSSVANLPNVSGSSTLLAPIQKWDIAYVGAQAYACWLPTSGSAVWFAITQYFNPFGLQAIQTVADAAATIIAGPNVRVLVTHAAAACTLTLPTVLAGAPIGTVIRIEKANTSANGIVVTPDAGASINAAAADATQALVGGVTASTVVSAAATNDVATIYVRTGALTWRSSMA